ncbi:MAG TPA: glycosyltransferase family 39 protein [Patescibacteria group bacterium]|nr:glycosyltransferase family 39 protein [Patescibacteria group bacterium]
MKIKKIVKRLLSDNYTKTAYIFFGVGAFLRFYRLAEFVTFLGDEGRDAIIIKRLLTLEHVPAIGAPTSVGQVYLGPFYYYFIAPWLWFFNYNPLGLAVGVAFFSSLFILIIFFALRDLFDKKRALIATFLITFSSVLIEFSRFSWNPNLLPVFSFLTIYFFIKALQKKRIFLFFISGMMFSFTLQLHYLSLLLIPPFFITMMIYIIERKHDRMRLIIGSSVALVSCFIFLFPLLIFDLRHQFLNTKNFIALFSTESSFSSGWISELFSSFWHLNTYLFSIEMNKAISSMLLILFFLFFVTRIHKREPLRIFLLFFLFLVAGIALYSGPKIPHYFGAIYPIYIVIVSYLIVWLLSVKKGTVVLYIFLGLYLFFQSYGYFFLFGKGSFQIDHAQRVSRIIMDNITQIKYTVTGFPQKYSDSVYRYFLEVWERRSIEKDSLERAQELFVVCDGSCWPIGHPQWDIAYFAPNKVVGKWRVDNVTIYKLVR